MKSAKTIVILLLILGNIILGYYLYGTKKKFNDFIRNVDIYTEVRSDLIVLDIQLEVLRNLKRDSISQFIKKSNYELYFNGALHLYSLPVKYERFTTRKGILPLEHELHLKISTEYSLVQDKAQSFFFMHRDFETVQNADIDSLILYYTKIRSLTEELSNVKIQP